MRIFKRNVPSCISYTIPLVCNYLNSVSMWYVNCCDFFGIYSPKVITFSEKSRLFTIILTICLFISGIIITFALSIQQDYIV